MRLLSTAGASFSFDETLPPAPPPILSSLQDPELRKNFERFAAFLYDSAKLATTAPIKPRDALSRAIYLNCVSRLLQLSGPDPVIVNDTYVNGSGISGPGQRCLLQPSPLGTESLTSLIVRRFEEIRATSPAEAYQFQLYLYLAINYFFVWHCTEIHATTTNLSNITAHRFSQQIQDYVASYAKYCWTGLSLSVEDPWFWQSWFTKACIIEYPAKLTFSDIWAHFAGYSWSGNMTRLRAVKTIAETLRRANVRFLESEVKAIVSRLVGSPSGAGTALVDAYDDFAMYGLGDGTGTKGMFGRQNYGLGFFNYSYDYSGGAGNSGRVVILPTSTIALPFCTSDHDSTAFFYFGVEAESSAIPRILLTLYDAHGTKLADSIPLLTQGPDDYRFSGVPGSIAAAGSFGVGSIDSAQAVLMSDPLPPDDPEEVVFIVFKNRMGELPSVQIEAEWTFNDNRFAGADAIGGPVFSDQTLQDRLKIIIAQVVATTDVDIQTFIQGYGIGESLNRGATEPGCDLVRSANQADTHHSDSSYAARRYCHGRIHWSPSNCMLWFTAEGFVSPLRCTWDSHLVPTGNRTLQGTFGQYLLPTSQPSYNCVLSVFRAFSICEAMIQAMTAKAAKMASDGDITTAQKNTLIGALNTHLTQEAVGHIQTPGGANLMRRNPLQEILLTHDIFHAFKVQ